jgi:hypothetical protein
MMKTRRLDQRHCGSGDAFALGDEVAVTLRQRRLATERPHSATIGAIEKALLGEFVEIAADGLGGNLQMRREVGDAQARRSVQLCQNLPLPIGFRTPCAHGSLRGSFD